jgi:beta-N-acetylhexosaminidase
MTKAAIFGCSGLSLNEEERGFFRETAPWGFILFARNIDNPDQVSALCDDLRESVGRDAPILIDQEGGRVARLRPPHWREWSPALTLAEATELGEAERCAALSLRYEIIGRELRACGIDVDCAPLLDVPAPEGHDVIGDRALGHNAESITLRARAVYDGLLRAGVLPVVKHVPGHGRAAVDSHKALPIVDASLDDLRSVDFAPFAAFADAPLAMTAHVVYSAIDSERCATVSPTVIALIRDELGMDGLLMTDDLSMHALKGDFADRTRDSLAAGCDVILHCNGDMDEMRAIAVALPELTGDALRRAQHAEALRSQADTTVQLDALDKRYATLVERVGALHA